MDIPKFVWYVLALAVVGALTLSCIALVVIFVSLLKGAAGFILLPGVTLWIQTLH
jgi:hypothetical protein